MFDDSHQRQISVLSIRRAAKVAVASLIAATCLQNAAAAQPPVEFKGHEEVVYAGKFLPDGKALVTASFDQTLKLWDVATQATMRTMEGHTGIVLTVDVSPDGKLIASGSSDRTIRLWDVPKSDPISTRKIHENSVTAMATSKDGSLIATGDDKGLIKIWSNSATEDSAPESASPPAETAKEISIGKAISKLAWKNDNKSLAAACDDGSLVVVLLAADGSSEVSRLIAHEGKVTGVGFTPNNQYIFSCGSDGFVRRWPTAIPRPLTFEGLSSAATALAIHPKGTAIVVAGKDGQARILKRADGAVIHTLEGNSETITDVSFNRAGSQVAILSAHQVVRVFNASTGKLDFETTAAKSPLTSVVFSADGKDVIVGSERGDILAHELVEKARFRSLSKSPKPVRTFALTSDGSRLVFAGDDNRFWVRDNATGKTERGADFDEGVTAIAISPDNSTIAVGLTSGSVVTLDSTSFQSTAQLAGHTSAVQKIVFNMSGTQLVSSSSDGLARIWDLKAGAIAQSFSGDDNPIVDIAFQNDNKSLVTAHADGTVRVETIAAQVVHQADENGVNDLSISSNGSQYATAGEDGTIKLWNSSNSTPSKSFSGIEGPAVCVSLSPDNRQVAAGGSDKTVRTWNLGNQSGYFRLSVPAIPRRVAFSPDSSRLVTALSDNMLQCFDPTPLNPQPAEPPGRDASQVLRGHTSTISEIAWTSDSQTLRTCSADMTLREWSVALPKEKARLSGHSQQIYAVVFSPDGKTVASASADKTVRLWNLETRRAIKTLTTLPAAVYGLDYSSDGKQLAIAGADSTVRLLDVASGRTIRQFEGPEHAVYSVALSSDNTRIAAAGMGIGTERKVYLWSVDSSEPRTILHGHNDDIYRVQFNSTGSRLMSIGYSGSLRIWDIEAGKPVLEQDSGVVSYSGEYSPDADKILITSNDRTARLITLPDSAR